MDCRRTLLGVALTLAAVLLMSPGAARAESDGISNLGSSGCQGCHAASDPDVPATANITFGSPRFVGSPISVQVRVSGMGSAGGFNLTMGNGTLSTIAGDTGVLIENGQATHNAPRGEVSGTATWNFEWTPNASGSIAYTLWGNSVGLTNGSADDWPMGTGDARTGTVNVVRTNGSACTSSAQCSGSCVDNVCCNNSCLGSCRACSVARGGMTDGVCTDIAGEDCVGLATCQDAAGPNFFSCSCPSPQYTGDGRASGTACTDVDECATNSAPCNDNGDHDDGGGQDGEGCTEIPIGSWVSPGYTCTCDTAGGYAQGGSPRSCVVGDECTAGADDCDTNPVAVCNDPNPAPTSTGDFTCTCPGGYTQHPVNDGHGPNGCVNIVECGTVLDDCDVNATCMDTPGSFTCTCNLPAWMDAGGTNGRSCVNVDECATGINNCDLNATCTDTPGSFNCVCNDGYFGSGVTCTNIDECAAGTDDCDTNATCTDTDGSFDCDCNTGWMGDGVTCTDLDECMDPIFTSQCSTAATCNNLVGDWECVCNAGFRGDGVTCDDIDECTEGTAGCDANATCMNNIGDFSCICNEFWTGSGFTCVDIDECARGIDGCGLNQDCFNEVGAAPRCECAAGFSDDGTGACRVICGDGGVGPGEECDDGNVDTGDGCNNVCDIEPGWACFQPGGGASVCSQTCGDGLIDAAEECDDGTANNSDTVPNACRVNCRRPTCGDSVTDDGEECDDGEANSDDTVDGCRTTCNESYCGDGIIDSDEMCDPGGGVPGSVVAGTCTSMCTPDAGIDPMDPPILTGGACRVTPRSDSPVWPLALLAGIVALVIRRRRRR